MKTKNSRRRSSAEVTGDPRDGFPEGTVVAGRFVVQEELGRGGMGSVYRVVDRVLEQQVALKVPLRVPSESLRHKAAIRREVVLARRVTHPAVARVYDVGEHDELAFLTMELVTGNTLHARLRRGPMSLEEALQLSQQVSCGLHAAHEVGVLHLDLKPGNLICREELAGGIKIVDFGIANVVGARAEGTGTLDYMAPEQLDNAPLTGAADVFALGLVLHLMLTGQRAFEGDTPEARAYARLDRPPLPLPPGTPGRLVDLMRRMLAREPADRPTMAEVAQHLNLLATEHALPSAPRSLARPGERAPVIAPALQRALLLSRSEVLEPTALSRNLELLRKVDQQAPGDPLVSALRAVILTRLGTLTPSDNAADLTDEAHEALQVALQRAPTLPETHLADALVNDATGDVHGTLRSLERALARDPSHSPSRALLARLELEAGLRSELNLGYLEQVAAVPAWLKILQLRELLFAERYDDAWLRCDSLEDEGGPSLAATLLRVRCCIYRRDVDRAEFLLPAVVDMGRTDPFRHVLVHVLERVAGRRDHRDTERCLASLFERKTSPKRHSFWLQLFAELAAHDEPKAALTYLCRAAHLPLTDLRWLDGAPALAPLRTEPAYLRCRETVVARLRPLLAGDERGEPAPVVTMDDDATLPIALAYDPA